MKLPIPIHRILAKFRSSLRIRIVTRSSRQLTLAEWQASEFLVSDAKRLLADPTMRVALDVLRNESPVNYGLPELGVQPTDRIVHQAKTEGYQLCLNNLEALGILKVESRPVEATFEAPEDEPRQFDQP